MCVASIIQNTNVPYRLHILGSHITDEVRKWVGDSGTITEVDRKMTCLSGRRHLLDCLPDATDIVYLDDDITVTQGWLSDLHDVKDRHGASVVAASLISDTNASISDGIKYNMISGARVVHDGIVKVPKALIEVRVTMCHGGATLYDAESLRATEYRSDFGAGFEDWDQTLQISQDQGGTVYGSGVLLFHVHGAESRAKPYMDARWRWDDLMRSAVAMYDRWGVKTGVISSYKLAVFKRDEGAEIDNELLDRCNEIIKEVGNVKTIDCVR